jgi:predicted nucleic acid-binding protein
MKFIVLDSTPLGLLTQRPGALEADACRQWLATKISQGSRIIVPEIVDYELRRELIRSQKQSSLLRLDQFISHASVTFLPISTAAMKLAAQLWADARQRGVPTADPHALDADVILCAQILAAGFQTEDFIVATTNIGHISIFVPAKIWSSI